MKDILIFGAGGFGREVQWLIERINQEKPIWHIEGYLDDGMEPGTVINGYPVLGGMDKLKEYKDATAVVCAIGSAMLRRRIITEIKKAGRFIFPNLIDPGVKMSPFITMGEGNIICAGNILTVNIIIDDFVIINLSCTVGHDAVLGSFTTVYPGVNISGCTRIETGAEIGTGSKIIQGMTIGENAVIGAGAVVIHNIPAECTAVGVPAHPVKFAKHGENRSD